MEDLISVIVPIYNTSKYLPKCIDSIINQTYSNLEILLIDDGSKDNSLNICKDYEKKDNRIKVFHKENGGLSDARNYGIDVCVGKYLIFIDSDDYVHEKMLEILYNNLISTGSQLSVCNFFRTNNRNTDIVINNQITKVYSKLQCFDNLYNNLYVTTVIACNKLYESNIWTNLRFPLDKLHEDDFVIHYIIEKCNNVVYTNLKLYYYYVRENSITNSYSKKRLDSIDAYYDRMKFFKKNSYKDLYFKAYIAYVKVIGMGYINVKRYLNDKGLMLKLKHQFSSECRRLKNENIYLNHKTKIQFFLMNHFAGFYIFILKLMKK